MDGDLAVVGEFADEMMEREDSTALLSGSLFYIRNVEVHPAFSGQQIGARLVAHALWSLSRSDGDVAMLLARPMTSRFHPGEPDCSAASIRRLAACYRRMGSRCEAIPAQTNTRRKAEPAYCIPGDDAQHASGISGGTEAQFWFVLSTIGSQVLEARISQFSFT